MKKILFAVLLLATQAAKAEWITLSPSNIDNIQLVATGITTGYQEGVYIVFKTDFVTTSTCTSRKTIAILEPKLVDRAYSGLLYAMAANKTTNFYLDSPTRCTASNTIPVAMAFYILP